MKLWILRGLAAVGLGVFFVSGFVTLFTGELVWLTLVGAVVFVVAGLMALRHSEQTAPTYGGDNRY